MTAYTKSTNFATKDTLTSGDPLKIVKGTEINTEFDNIQTAVNSKSDTASPTFTGTVTAAALTTTGNTILGDASTDTLNVGNGGLVKDASGRVGIGTASPTQKLEVGGGIYISGSATLGTAMAATLSYESAVSRYYIGDGTGYSWAFSKRSASTTTDLVTITDAGNLLVNTSDAGMASGNGIKLTPAGDGATYPRVGVVTAATTNGQSVNYSLYSTGAAAYRFYVGAGGTISATSATITSLSDQRLKENIRDLDDGLASIMALKPRKFDWKEGKGADIKNARGFIAQEFETVFPDMIEEWRDQAPEGEEPYKGVNANLIPTLVKAIQEMKAIIDTQASTITTLTDRITALENT
jgi:hypothetical protein